MLKDVTLGQYFPGDTIVHKLDPRTKLFCVMLYIAEIFTANTLCGILLSVATLAMGAILSKTTVKQLLKGMKPLLFIIVLTGLLNLFYTAGETVLVKFWIFTITREGVLKAAQMVSRIVMLICGTFLLTLTTSPLSITDGLERLLNPLNKVHFPVHELSMMMSIALRFIPTLMEETDKIMSAQKARGADFETGSIFRRAKALLPVLVPLFVSAFRRADELATAMECRCYHGGTGRTRMKELSMEKRDWLCILLFVLLLGIVIALRVIGL